MSSSGGIIITGASSGLGAEMARQFASRGYNLGLCARRTDRLEALKAELLAAHPNLNVSIKSLDVTDDAAVFDTFQSIADDFGHLDRVVVNAGLGKGAPLGTGKYDANKQTLMTNLVGGLAQMEAAMEIFRAQGFGHLVVVSSVIANRAMPGALAVYSASKVGIAYAAQGLQAGLDLENSPIDVSIIYPGYIESEMTANAGPSPIMAKTAPAVHEMVDAMEDRVREATLPAWPWRVLSKVMRYAPRPILNRIS